MKYSKIQRRDVLDLSDIILDLITGYHNIIVYYSRFFEITSFRLITTFKLLFILEFNCFII